MALISPQGREHNQIVAREKDLAAAILSDPGNEVARQYGLRYRLPDDLISVYRRFKIDLPEYNGDDSWTLPLPARLIIDPEGIIRHAAINADYTVRPDPGETLNVLRELF